MKETKATKEQMNQKEKLTVTGLDCSIALTVLLCLLICYIAELFGLRLQALAACTGAVMCVQEGKKASWKAGLNRILGVILGGLTGILVVLIDNAVQLPLLFCVLAALGILLNFLLCRAAKLPLIQARVSCITVLLVVLALEGGARIDYALGRFAGTLVGVAVSLLVSMTWEKLNRSKAS